MSEPDVVYQLDKARANIRQAETDFYYEEASSSLDALKGRLRDLYKIAWQGDEAAWRELRGLYLALAALAALLPGEGG